MILCNYFYPSRSSLSHFGHLTLHCQLWIPKSYQLTIDEVCAAVDSPTKLLMCAIEDRLDGLDEIEGPFGNGRLDDTIEEWFESSESGESDCGYDVSTRCQVEWLESKCPATAQYIHQGSTIVKDFTATESPNGISWTWEQCAKECYLSDECEFWILNNACQLRADKSGGYSTQNSMQVSGYKNANCDGVSESCKASCREMMQTRLEDEEAEWRASVEANEVSLQLCSYIISLFIDLHSLLTTILALCLVSVSSLSSTRMYPSIC